jgi:hypothetical protein
VFATWLCLSNQSSTHTVRQIEDMLHTIRQDKMRVNEFNTLFNRLVEELRQQRCLTDDDYRSTFAQDNMVMFPPVRESRETLSLYLAGLNSEIGTELRRLSMQQGLQGFLANGPGVLTHLAWGVTIQTNRLRTFVPICYPKLGHTFSVLTSRMLAARAGGHRRGCPRYSYNASNAGLLDGQGDLRSHSVHSILLSVWIFINHP